MNIIQNDSEMKLSRVTLHNPKEVLLSSAQFQASQIVSAKSPGGLGYYCLALSLYLISVISNFNQVQSISSSFQVAVIFAGTLIPSNVL